MKYIPESDIINEFKDGMVYKYTLNGKLIFEGNYLNGKRNGKCKEYTVIMGN